MSLAAAEIPIVLIDEQPESRAFLAAGLEARRIAVETAGSEHDAAYRLVHGHFRAAVLVHRRGGLDAGRGVDTLWRCDVRVPIVVLDLERSFDVALAVSALQATERGRCRLAAPGPDGTVDLETLAATLRDLTPYSARDATPLTPVDPIPGLIGHSPAMLELTAEIRRVARSRMPVLLTGETGVGKTQIARAVHDLSARAKEPFIVVDSTYLGHDLAHFHSHLFGHRRGAFTGAIASRTGLVAEADGGTLFFDEVGEVPLEVQSRLLRLLQERRFQPLGSDAEKSADVRIIAATNRDLYAEVRAGRFRADLLSRLHPFTIRVPPLRERIADIPDLVRYVLQQLRARGEAHVPDFSERAVQRLMEEDWPWNVRDLFSVIEGTTTSLPNPTPKMIQEAHLRIPAPMAEQRRTRLRPLRVQLAEAAGPIIRSALVAVMSETRGNKSRAAKMLGISRARLNALLRLHGLDGYFRSDDVASGEAPHAAYATNCTPLPDRRQA